MLEFCAWVGMYTTVGRWVGESVLGMPFAVLRHGTVAEQDAEYDCAKGKLMNFTMTRADRQPVRYHGTILGAGAAGQPFFQTIGKTASISENFLYTTGR